MGKMTKPSWLKANNTALPKWVEQQSDTKRAKLYDSSEDVLYQSYKWKKMRKLYLSKHPLCEKCKAIGLTTASNTVDHVVPISIGGSRWSWFNWMALCQQCHQVKSNKERGGWTVRSKENENGELIPIDRNEAIQ